tara:strand:- start:262 stop:504 length:243 start_codon:yes stop_codon:yes gene_type:complete
MNVKILTLEDKILEAEAKSVIVPGENGTFEMLDNHAPIISTLNSGTIKVTEKNSKIHNINIANGSVEMVNNQIIVLAEIN